MLARTPNLADPLSKTPSKVVAGELRIMPCGTNKLSSAEPAGLCFKKTGNQRNKSDIFKLIFFRGGGGGGVLFSSLFLYFYFCLVVTDIGSNALSKCH